MHGSLATKLRVLRAERGLTVRQVAELSGVAKETISQIERGERHPYDRTLAKLARAYSVPVQDLIEEPEAALAGAKKAKAPDQGQAPPEPHVTLEQLHELGIPANASEVFVLNQMLSYRENPPDPEGIRVYGHVRKEGEPVDVAEVEGIKLLAYLLTTDQLTEEEIAAARDALYRELVSSRGVGQNRISSCASHPDTGAHR